MSLETLMQIWRGNSESAESVRNGEILITLEGETFPSSRVVDCTVSSDGRLVLIARVDI